MKFFNTAGPVNQEEHYKLDPLHRWDLEETLFLIQQKKYFVLHAPRQTGKTSCLLALQDYLNKSGNYNCIYLNVEGAQVARNDIAKGMKTILSQLCEEGKVCSQHSLPFTPASIIESSGAGDSLHSILRQLCEFSAKPLVLFIDEIDALVGDTLISVLRQLRSGYNNRPYKFPVSLILCGVRDIKDYRIYRSDGDIITGGSCFNIKSESLRLGNFSKDEVHKLLMEHTIETGQKFEDGVCDYIFGQTDGQPWLVNALAFELTFKMKENREPSILITKEMTKIAVNRIIVSRAVHLDQLADKLKEDRVRRVVLPMILGSDEGLANPDDEEYCIDLGLIKKGQKGLVIANPIYNEIIPRELTKSKQTNFLSRFDPQWINSDGSLNTRMLFNLFGDFWRKNTDIWKKDMSGYQEAAPHLVFQAFLQRVANGCGHVSREYALGRGRTDLFLEWEGPSIQRVVIELKIMRKRDGFETCRQEALEQTLEYAKKCSGSEYHKVECHIIIFDRDKKMAEWQNGLFSKTVEHEGIETTLWGM